VKSFFHFHKIKLTVIVIVTFLILYQLRLVEGWGFWGHEHINRMAVFTLPFPMLNLYKDNIEFITNHSVDPDKRRYVDSTEASHHFIDIDHYGKYPFPNLPHYWKDAVAKYSEDTLKKYGVVPWYVLLMLDKLTTAFKEKDKYLILHYSADLGHYIADAHVPLHCSSNYNGQLTHQEGIHALWESRIPELFGDKYNFSVGKAAYLKNPSKRIWEVVLESALEVDSVVSIEKKLGKQFSDDKKYEMQKRNSKAVKAYSQDYVKAYSDHLNGMVERRLRESILDVGSFWYTAWVNAGQPNLNNLKDTILNNTEQQKLQFMDKKWNEGKIMGRSEGDELH
jgi:hypothetical protein